MDEQARSIWWEHQKSGGLDQHDLSIWWDTLKRKGLRKSPWDLADSEDELLSVVASSKQMVEIAPDVPFPEWVELKWNTMKPGMEMPDFDAMTQGEVGAYVRRSLEEPSEEERIFGPTVYLKLVVHDGLVEADEIRFVRSPGQAELTAKSISEVPVRRLTTMATVKLAESIRIDEEVVLRRAAQRHGGDDGSAFQASVNQVTEGAFQATRRRRPMTDELLEEVAGVYRNDRTGAPTKAVQDHFPTSHRTAARYVGEARKRGFLGEYIRGGI